MLGYFEQQLKQTLNNISETFFHTQLWHNNMMNSQRRSQIKIQIDDRRKPNWFSVLKLLLNSYNNGELKYAVKFSIKNTKLPEENDGPYAWFSECCKAAFLKNWDSLHARLNSYYKACSYKKRSIKRLNLFKKNLQLKEVCWF